MTVFRGNQPWEPAAERTIDSFLNNYTNSTVINRTTQDAHERDTDERDTGTRGPCPRIYRRPAAGHAAAAARAVGQEQRAGLRPRSAANCTDHRHRPGDLAGATPGRRAGGPDRKEV